VSKERNATEQESKDCREERDVPQFKQPAESQRKAPTAPPPSGAHTRNRSSWDELGAEAPDVQATSTGSESATAIAGRPMLPIGVLTHSVRPRRRRTTSSTQKHLVISAERANLNGLSSVC